MDMIELQRRVYALTCPRCSAPPNTRCTTPKGKSIRGAHGARIDKARSEQ